MSGMAQISVTEPVEIPVSDSHVMFFRPGEVILMYGTANDLPADPEVIARLLDGLQIAVFGDMPTPIQVVRGAGTRYLQSIYVDPPQAEVSAGEAHTLSEFVLTANALRSVVSAVATLNSPRGKAAFREEGSLLEPAASPNWLVTPFENL
ncbi:MAG: hypothetical protein ACYDCQ_01430 [Dehalococcoidia bacterium]